MDFKHYSKKLRAAVCVLMCVFALSANAQSGWEMVKELPATNAFHIAKNGNLILADFQYDFTGGIYVSTDKGATWTKTAVQDYNYNAFYETDEYIFAAACSGRVARSNDGGLTWEVLNYGRVVEDLLGEELEYSAAYALTMHDGKLFVANFDGGGVVYSEDNGETWVHTDYESLSYGDVDPKLGRRLVENLYNIVSYEGELYTFGVYYVYRYLPETNSWEAIRDDSNFMAVSTVCNGTLCLGRSVTNYNMDEDFIVTLNKDGQWGALPRPETDDNNIRAMYADGDDLFVGMAYGGFYHTNDNGATWNSFLSGYPYGTPMQIRTDDNYVYLAVYDTPWSVKGISGLWRMAKSELSGVNNVQLDLNAQSKAIYDLSGRKVNGTRTPGLYIIDGKKVMVK